MTVASVPPTVLLLHGFLASRAIWSPLRSELGDGVRTVAPDLPGYGRAPRVEGAYTLESVVEALVPVVERAHPTHLVGHSMGAILALALAARLPGQFAGVGLLGLPVFASREEAIPVVSRGSAARRYALRHNRLAHASCVAFDRTSFAWAPPLQRLLAPSHPLGNVRGAWRHSFECHAGGLELIFAGNVPRLAASVDAPVVALHGGEDPLAPVQAARAVAAEAGWQFAVAPRAGHLLQLERRVLVARWLRERVLSLPQSRG